jgi:hypothetical protein
MGTYLVDPRDLALRSALYCSIEELQLRHERDQRPLSV